jgi:hypothetical protein
MNTVFLEIVKHLNTKFQITPILYASFALEKVLGTNLDAKDIDLLIPKHHFEHRHDIISYFLFQGYHYIHDDVIHLVKDGIDIELADESYWITHCHLDKKAFHTVHEASCTYQILGARNLMNLYGYLLTLKNRSIEKKQKDQVKIEMLSTCISNHSCMLD